MSFCHYLGCNNLIALHFDAPIQTELISEELTITKAILKRFNIKFSSQNIRLALLLKHIRQDKIHFYLSLSHGEDIFLE